jgi:hypothetical protein
VSQRQNTGRQEEYDYRANNTIQHAGVQYILDSIIAALQNPERKYHFLLPACPHGSLVGDCIVPSRGGGASNRKTIIVHSLVGARR